MATDLFAIAVDADDYATTAAHDVHRVITTRTDGGEVEEENDDDNDDEKEEEETQSRTFQSEENFQLQRKNYSAKIYGHRHHHRHHHPSRRCGLFEEFQLQVFDVGSKSVEGYAEGDGSGDGKEGDVEEKEKIQLSKSQIQFLGQVIGELYFEEEFEELLEFCRRVRRRCCCCSCGGQKGLEEKLGRWEGRCLERLGRGRGEGGLG